MRVSFVLLYKVWLSFIQTSADCSSSLLQWTVAFVYGTYGAASVFVFLRATTVPSHHWLSLRMARLLSGKYENITHFL